MTFGATKNVSPMTDCDLDKLHVALALNNEGVTLMEDGDITRGISLLQQSSALCSEVVRQIRNTKKTVSEPSSKNQPPNADSSITLDTDEGSDWQQDKRPEPRTALDFPRCPFTLPSHLHLIEKTASKYKFRGYLDWTALKLNSQPLSSRLSSFMMVSCVASINLAICYQYLGFCCHSTENTPFSRRHSLTMAAKSYEVAHYIMTQVPELQSDIRMLLQIMNNRCRILAALGDRKRVGLCSQRLLSILMYVVDHEEIDVSSTLLSNYLSNVCHLILRKKEVAAAA